MLGESRKACPVIRREVEVISEALYPRLASSAELYYWARISNPNGK